MKPDWLSEAARRTRGQAAPTAPSVGQIRVAGGGTAAAILWHAVTDQLRERRGRPRHELSHTPPLPATAEAVRAGAVGPEHVDVIRRVITALPPEVDPAERELAERTLAEAARTLDPGAVGKLGRTIQARLDQDGQPPSETELRNPINELRWATRRNGEIDFRG